MSEIKMNNEQNNDQNTNQINDQNTNQINDQNTNQINQLLYDKYIDYVFLLKSRNYEVKYYNYNDYG